MRWLAIHLPRLPLEVFSRAAPDEAPLAVSDAGGRRLLRCNRPALARGVRPGPSPAAARALAHKQSTPLDDVRVIIDVDPQSML
mgnify:CR=1 FL=1